MKEEEEEVAEEDEVFTLSYYTSLMDISCPDEKPA